MRLPAVFILYYAALGLVIPYFSSYLKSLGFDGGQMSRVMAMMPLCTILATPFWGLIADRIGDPRRVLRWVVTGGVIAFVPLLYATTYFQVLATMACFSLFITSVAPLTDALSAAAAKRTGTEYARIRLFGSIGFSMTSVPFAYALKHGAQIAHILPGTLALLAGAMAIIYTLEREPEAGHLSPPRIADCARLLARPEMFFFLLAGLVHMGSMVTYYFCYALHVEALQQPSMYIGLGLGIGVAAETLAMWNFRRLRARVPLIVLMLISQFATIARWVATGHASSGVELALLQVVHGFSFGIYFPACIAYLENITPPELRATSRALFQSISFGIGGVLGNLLAGAMYQSGGSAHAFNIAGLTECAAPVLLLAAYIFTPRAVGPARAT
jgi:MFS transporter, PPP family, 3-phenylpropionic acid transporter